VYNYTAIRRTVMANSKKDKEIEQQLDEYFKKKFKKLENWDKDNKKSKSNNSAHGSAGALYFVGFIGSLVYWMQAAIGFGAVVTGFLKAMVWPAYIVYKLLESFYGVVI
jgi:hypothetical protein